MPTRRAALAVRAAKAIATLVALAAPAPDLVRGPVRVRAAGTASRRFVILN